MPTLIRASAPGKLFLIGEYAVLNGAPALLTAVDRRVHVTTETAPNERWALSAPNLGLHDLDLGADARAMHDSDDATRAKLAVFQAVHAESSAALGASLPPLHVTIDSSAFAHDGHKLGLGSSAAVAAALCAALARAAGERPAPAALARRAITAHRRAQNGAGSGGDVAAAVYGGLISYRQDTTPIPLAWPSALAAFAVITGEGARTPTLLDAVRAYAERAPQAHARDLAELARLADTATDCLDSTADFLALAAAYFAALRRLDDHAKAGIVSAQHERLAELVHEHGGVFKTSGAGGGDVGLVFVRRGADERRLRDTLGQAGAKPVDLAFGAAGVECDKIMH